MDELSLAGVSGLLEQLQATRDAAAVMRSQLDELTVAMTSKQYLFDVSVNRHGELTGFSFADERYRTLAPAELAQLIQETVSEAQQQVRARAEQIADRHFPGSVAPALEPAAGDGEPASPTDPVDGLLNRLQGWGMSAQDLQEIRHQLGGNHGN